MRAYDIIVAIHQTRKTGDKTKHGPESLDQFGAAAGVSHLSSRPEGPALARRLPDGWGVDHETHDRKLVKIVLPTSPLMASTAPPTIATTEWAGPYIATLARRG